VIFDWSCLINIPDVFDHASDIRLAGSVVAKLFIVVLCVHILWLNCMSQSHVCIYCG